MCHYIAAVLWNTTRRCSSNEFGFFQRPISLQAIRKDYSAIVQESRAAPAEA
jgi:hypothetical protein